MAGPKTVCIVGGHQPTSTENDSLIAFHRCWTSRLGRGEDHLTHIPESVRGHDPRAKEHSWRPLADRTRPL